MANADRLIEIFNEAKARPAGAERERFLAEACPGGPALKEQVVSLLRAYEGAGDFLKDTLAVAPAALQPPTIRYLGDYELLEEIARGGMGVVFKARQVSLNRIVAVKMILAGQLARPEDVQRFRAEAEAAANLKHPNIVAIHEVGEHEGQHYFSMDFIEGRSLAELIRDGPLPAQRAARYVQIIAEAIHYAHERGTLHRDLKPSNVLIDTHDQPQVTDFGLAKRFGVSPSGGPASASSGALELPGVRPAKALTPDPDLTLTGQILGSPNYMPPEQASAKHGAVGPHSDIYSLGALLYHLLTGRPPFAAESIHETLVQVIEAQPASPRLLNPSVPRDLEIVCLKCLRKEPQKRYRSAAALAADVRRWQTGESILARPANPAERLGRWCRGHQARAILGTFLAGLGLLTIYLFCFSLTRFDVQRWPYFLLVLGLGALFGAVPTLGGLLLLMTIPASASKCLKCENPEIRAGVDWRGPPWAFLPLGIIPGMLLRSLSRKRPFLCLHCGSVFYSHTRTSRVFVVVSNLYILVCLMGILSLLAWGWDNSNASKPGIQVNQRTNRSNQAGTLASSKTTLAAADPMVWSRWGWMLAKSNRVEEAYAAMTRAIELGKGSTNFDARSLSECYQLRSWVLKRLNRLEEAASDNLAARHIPTRDPQANRGLIDLSLHYNAALDENWLRDWPANDLSSLPGGIQKLAGAEFDIRGLIQLSSTRNPRLPDRFPNQVEGIRMGQRCTELDFLHAVTGVASNGVKVGHYCVEYADRQILEIPLVYAEDLRDWWLRPNKSKAATRAVVAWTGTNAASAASNATLRLFKLTWTNPRPTIAVDKIDFVSANSKCAPFLVAITATTKEIPALFSLTDLVEVDLSRFYNAQLAEDWINLRAEGYNLARLQVGPGYFAEVPFVVHGIVQLSGQRLKRLNPGYPEKVTGIPVNLKCRRFHVLHGVGWIVRDGTPVARYVIHYADGKQVEKPILYGNDLRDVWLNPGDPDKTLNSAVAWKGTCAAMTKSGQALQLYKTTLENFRADVDVTRIDFISDMTDAAPFLIAITAEP